MAERKTGDFVTYKQVLVGLPVFTTLMLGIMLAGFQMHAKSPHEGAVSQEEMKIHSDSAHKNAATKDELKAILSAVQELKLYLDKDLREIRKHILDQAIRSRGMHRPSLDR